MDKSAAEQASFDLIIASIIDGIYQDEIMDLDDEDRIDLLDGTLNVLEDHLDEEGQDMLDDAFERFSREYNIVIETEDIISSFEWNKKRRAKDE